LEASDFVEVLVYKFILIKGVHSVRHAARAPAKGARNHIFIVSYINNYMIDVLHIHVYIIYIYIYIWIYKCHMIINVIT